MWSPLEAEVPFSHVVIFFFITKYSKTTNIRKHKRISLHVDNKNIFQRQQQGETALPHGESAID